MPNDNAQNEPTRIVFAKGTDVGRQRGHNEDYVDVFSPPDPAQRRQKGHLFIVADGMGGHQAGEVASKAAVQTISHEYYADPDPNVASALVRSVQKANAAIHQQAQETLAQIGMGTTVVAAVARGSELVLANVGDSRAYLLRNGTLKQVTRDHSFVEEQIRAGILSREEARNHPQRNVVTRALGAKPEVEVDTYGGTLAPGDTLLLCSDGLSEPVHDQDMARILSQYPPPEAVSRLIALANERGGGDNISALVVRAMPAQGAAAAKEAATTKKTVPTAPTTETSARRGPSTRVLLGIGAGAILILAAVVAGLLFLIPNLGFGWGGATATPTAAPQPTTAPPVPSPTATPQPAATLQPAAPTATPRLGFSFLEPEDGAVFAPGEQVDFRWGPIGGLPEPYAFVVRTNAPGYEELCRGSEASCNAPLEPGEYEWWIEIWSGDALVSESDHQTLIVAPEATESPLPTPTSTGAPSPQETPSPSAEDA